MRKSFFVSVIALMIAGYISAVFACDRLPKVVQKDGLYIVKINYENKYIYPYVATELRTVKDMALRSNAEVAINAGFFDAKNKKTVSYVTLNGQILADPTKNENLTSNEKLQPYLDRIFNRGEIRFYNCSGEKKVDITYHDDEYLPDCELTSSIQAGPILLPEMDLEKEYFVIERNGKILRDGAGLTRRTDRSMIGIKGKYLYIIITDENSPVTIYELQNKVKKLGLEKALAFDGGGSVSLYAKKKQYVKLSDDYFYQDREEKGASRAVKSALIVKDKEIIPPDIRTLLMLEE
ncbi:MAG: phosphodiester glycosidase family protein [bacterium]|nr:phosphodiester glycosidase family protein [bacterium]